MAHAHLQPSSAHRWMSCPGSAGLSATVPDPGSEAADQGTVCHLLLANAIDGGGIPSIESMLGGNVSTGTEDRPITVKVTEDMVAWVKQAFEWVEVYRASMPGTRVFSELKVEVGQPFGFPDELWGTADVVMVNATEIVVLDAKFGFQEVEALGNPQASLYAIGVAEAYGWPDRKYRLAIVQPRSPQPVKVEDLTRDELRDRFERYKAKVAEALQPDARLVPSDEACRYCRAAGVCRALHERTLDLARREFSEPRHMSKEELLLLLAEADRIRAGLAAVEQQAKTLLTLGQKLDGWKLVPGRKNRIWKDERTIGPTLELLGLNVDQYAPRKLITPAQAETKLPGGKKLLEPLVDKPLGGPTLVRADDARESMAPDFEPQ